MNPESRGFIDIVNTIREDHEAAARRDVKDPGLVEDLVRNIEVECQKLASFLSAAQVRLRSYNLGTANSRPLTWCTMV